MKRIVIRFIIINILSSSISWRMNNLLLMLIKREYPLMIHNFDWRRLTSLNIVVNVDIDSGVSKTLLLPIHQRETFLLNILVGHNFIYDD